MKKIVYIAVLLFGFLIVSCDDFLDREPKSNISQDSFWKSEGDLQKWNAGMYLGMQNTLQSAWADWGEIRGGSFCPRGTNADMNLMYNSLTSLSGSASWGNLYTTIYRANAAIQYIPKSGLAETTTSTYLSQAYVMRALMYFYAIRVWGDVPLILEPLEDVANQQIRYPRESIHTIKAKIMEDIENALTLFGPASTSIGTSSKFYLNRGAAMALKADVHMWFKEYGEAIQTIDQLVNLYGYELTPTGGYRDQFLNPQNSKEMIFNIWWDYTEKGGGFGMATNYSSGSNTIKYHPNEDIFTELVRNPRKKEDQRVTMILDTMWVHTNYTDFVIANGEIKSELFSEAMAGNHGNAANFQLKCPKFLPWSDSQNSNNGGYVYPGNAQDETKMPVYRLADMLLLKAEALILKPTPDLKGAIQIVNRIRERAGWKNELLDENASYTAHQALVLVLEERMYEFWGEGKRWFDLVRTDMVKEFVDETINKAMGGTAGFEIGASKPSADHIGGYGRMLWPIHSNAFLKNPLLDGQQNKPYDQ